MALEKAFEYIRDLNEKGFAGFYNRRLPTLDEAMSLLKANPGRNELRIDPVFKNKQRWVWTSDQLKNENQQLTISYSSGELQPVDRIKGAAFVRAVRQRL